MDSITTIKSVNLLFILSSVFLFNQEIHAQEESGFSGGIRGGMVASEISGDNLGGPNNLGWFAGVFTTRNFSEYSSWMLEIMYIQKGSRSVPNEDNGFFEYAFELQYVEVPLMIRTDITPYTDIRYLDRLMVYGGLSASFIVESSEKEQGAEVQPGEVEDFHPVELNLILGVSYPVVNNLDFHFGFSHALTPARPHSGRSMTWFNRGQYNMLWTIGLSYELW